MVLGEGVVFFLGVPIIIASTRLAPPFLSSFFKNSKSEVKSVASLALSNSKRYHQSQDGTAGVLCVCVCLCFVICCGVD